MSEREKEGRGGAGESEHHPDLAKSVEKRKTADGEEITAPLFENEQKLLGHFASRDDEAPPRDIDPRQQNTGPGQQVDVDMEDFFNECWEQGNYAKLMAFVQAAKEKDAACGIVMRALLSRTLQRGNSDSYLQEFIEFAMSHLSEHGEELKAFVRFKWNHLPDGSRFFKEPYSGLSLFLDHEGELIAFTDRDVQSAEEGGKDVVHIDPSESYIVLTGPKADQTFSGAERPIFYSRLESLHVGEMVLPSEPVHGTSPRETAEMNPHEQLIQEYRDASEPRRVAIRRMILNGEFPMENGQEGERFDCTLWASGGDSFTEKACVGSIKLPGIDNSLQGQIYNRNEDVVELGESGIIFGAIDGVTADGKIQRILVLRKLSVQRRSGHLDRHYPYTVFLEPGDALWEKSDNNPALIIRSILRDPVAKDILLTQLTHDFQSVRDQRDALRNLLRWIGMSDWKIRVQEGDRDLASVLEAEASNHQLQRMRGRFSTGGLLEPETVARALALLPREKRKQAVWMANCANPYIMSPTKTRGALL